MKKQEKKKRIAVIGLKIKYISSKSKEKNILRSIK
jgi:hypothetical protein